MGLSCFVDIYGSPYFKKGTRKMNANKLADDLDNANGFQYVAQLGLASQAATMLRQQQEEIKDLKQQVAFLEDWRDTWRPFLKAIMGKVNDERK